MGIEFSRASASFSQQKSPNLVNEAVHAINRTVAIITDSDLVTFQRFWLANLRLSRSRLLKRSPIHSSGPALS